jgi:hypothetical protein
MKNLVSEINMTTSVTAKNKALFAVHESEFGEDTDFLALLDEAGVNLGEYDDVHEAASMMSDFMGRICEDETAYYWVN